jgi:hypothetical protein
MEDRVLDQCQRGHDVHL